MEGDWHYILPKTNLNHSLAGNTVGTKNISNSTFQLSFTVNDSEKNIFNQASCRHLS